MKIKKAICVALCFLTLAASAAAVSIESVSVSASVNSPPIAENVSISTYRNVSVSGNMRAVDPEGDLISYQLRSKPEKGELKVNDDGSFIYTPLAGKKGRDSFCYAACDSSGNFSEPATVTIIIEKQKTKTTYADMEGRGEYYSALRLAEAGIFTGEKLGNGYCFSPDTEVTRGEFLAMCSALTDTVPLSDVTRTGFFDDADIDPWLKPYISAALMKGAVRGYPDSSGKIVFSPGGVITMAEAAVMLNNFLEISDVKDAFLNADVPAWASQAVSNLSSCDIYSGAPASRVLTRADAAVMLNGAITVLEQRGKK
ncbi:MAG: S-layer homology domain-containing protein [Oscillospiraceae bacterium]|nr:S-layer homology domain-containing protein [Oscillospiraceae bacterium]